MSIQKANRWYFYAFEEGDRNGLMPVASAAHSLATWWLTLMGYSERQRPDIVSGYRSPERQRELKDAWDRGERDQFIGRPACESWHTLRRAWDVETDVQGFPLYQMIMQQTPRVRVGSTFGDEGHFDIPGNRKPPNICD